MKLTVIVAAHKPYPMPQDAAYLPVQAGAALHEDIGFQRDDEGENISARNPLYCELTALYWAWKNCSCDALGLAHYRRYLSAGEKKAADGEEVRRLLEKHPVLLPKKRHYWIETGASQYVHAHGQESLDALRSVMKALAPQYLPAFEKSLQRRSGHRFNMFVMRRGLADAYCEWLFMLLFALEKQIGGTKTEIARLYGFLSERMLDCWIETNGISYAEMKVYSTERTNWLKKGAAFVGRKLRRKTHV